MDTNAFNPSPANAMPIAGGKPGRPKPSRGVPGGIAKPRPNPGSVVPPGSRPMPNGGKPAPQGGGGMGGAKKPRPMPNGVHPPRPVGAGMGGAVGGTMGTVGQKNTNARDNFMSMMKKKNANAARPLAGGAPTGMVSAS